MNTEARTDTSEVLVDKQKTRSPVFSARLVSRTRE